MEKNNNLSSNFKKAANDYYYLLGKSYPKKATLKLISDKYRLSCLERSVMLRGIVGKKTANERKKKILLEENIINKILLIDCYNVLITVNSYLNGKFLYIANDGFLRDAAETHGKLSKSDLIEKALILLFKYINTIKVKEVNIYIDSPVSYSKEFSNKISKLFNEYKINGKNFVVKSADYYLINSSDGICSTSDSTIIDNRDEVFDLAFYILKYHFNPDFIFINRYFK